MNKRKFRTFDEVQIEHYRKHPRELKDYIRVALEEYQKDGDESRYEAIHGGDSVELQKAFLSALAVAAQVHGGFSKLSKETGLNRENLYRALSERADPRLSTILHVLHCLGYSLKIA